MASRRVTLLLLVSGFMTAWANAGAEGKPPVARAEYCYAGLFAVYAASYYPAGVPGSACLELEYRRAIDAAALAKATWRTFEDRHGAAAVQRFRPFLERIAAAYRDVDEDAGYRYCVHQDTGGQLFHGTGPVPVLEFEDDEFARLYMQLWVAGERDGKPDWAFRDCS